MIKWMERDERYSLSIIQAAFDELDRIVNEYPSSAEDQAFDDVKKNAATILDLMGFIITALDENWASELTKHATE